MNHLHQNANWNCNSLLQNNKLSFNATTAAKMALKKDRKTEKFLNSSKFQVCNSCKNESITPKRKL
jgi:hypothetical protein